MKIFQVLKPGLFTTVQDLGRYGYLRYGVPVSGAMDTFSAVVANYLVGNSSSDACLEITLIGPELKALTKTQIAITGGSTSPKINGQNISMWQTVTVQNGDVISFGRVESGCRVYFAIRGGINVPTILGSKSTYVRGHFGGLDGRILKAGDVIEGYDVPLLEFGYYLPEGLVPKFTNNFNVNVVLGPQDNMFTEDGIETFLSSTYKVTPEADRMGYRLEGPSIEHKQKAEIISDAVLPGAVQVPKNGKPIVLMCDAQTTGGYPKIARVITSDIALLGQAKPGDNVKFVKVTTREANERAREYYKLLNNLKVSLKSYRLE